MDSVSYQVDSSLCSWTNDLKADGRAYQSILIKEMKSKQKNQIIDYI